MCEPTTLWEDEMAQAMSYLYQTVQIKYPTLSPWHDDLVEEVLLRVLINRQKGENITHWKGYLTGILIHVCNDMLRKQYRNQTLRTKETSLLTETQPEEDTAAHAALRREVARLTYIYREVTVRHYFLGQPVEKIATELGIPKGTVLSRLSKARDTIRKGLETPMEKYTEASYAPKSLQIGIWGWDSMKREPFSLVKGLIEQNVLINAYEKPLSLREIGDRMGVACAYLESICDTLVDGELLGRTTGGLLYTRCFLQTVEESYGNVEAQKALANEMASPVWDIVKDILLPFLESPACEGWNGKQKASLLLLKLYEALCHIQNALHDADVPENPPERPNGGCWYASGTVYNNAKKQQDKDDIYSQYYISGPLESRFSPQNDGHLAYFIQDCASIFGSAHWEYGSLSYSMDVNQLFRLYASLANPNIAITNVRYYENMPRLHELHLIRQKADGGWELDIPYLPFADHQQLCQTVETMEKKLLALLKPSFEALYRSHVNKIPSHVDGIAYFRHMGALIAYKPAQLMALLPYLPWEVKLGETPLVYMAYDPDVHC